MFSLLLPEHVVVTKKMRKLTNWKNCLHNAHPGYLKYRGKRKKVIHTKKNELVNAYLQIYLFIRRYQYTWQFWWEQMTVLSGGGYFYSNIYQCGMTILLKANCCVISWSGLSSPEIDNKQSALTIKGGTSHLSLGDGNTIVYVGQHVRLMCHH